MIILLEKSLMMGRGESGVFKQKTLQKHRTLDALIKFFFSLSKTKYCKNERISIQYEM